MNTRDIFNKVKKHLLEQVARSKLTQYMCAYRSEEGLKCAVGCLIDDEYYHEKLEGYTVGSDRVQHALEKSLGNPLTNDQTQMLFELQQIHDTKDIEEWEKMINVVGLQHLGDLNEDMDRR